MNSFDIIRQRLYNQQIAKSRFKKPGDLVSWFGGIQGQDYAGAKWAIALRLKNLTDNDIEKAIAGRTIIRTWAMRGTLHFAAAEDTRWILSLVAPRIIGSNAARYKQLELDKKTLAKCNKLLIKILEGGKQLTREELTIELKRSGILADGVRLSHLLQHAGLNQLICFGTRRNKKFTYTLLDECIPKAKTLEHDEALAELTKRYFTSRGPATLQDFIWWSGFSAADARVALEMIKPQLIKKTLSNQIYCLIEQTHKVETSLSAGHLLPAFDEYFVSYKDRKEVLDPKFKKQFNAGGGMLSPTIVINGKTAGTWKRSLKKDKVIITTSLFRRLTKTEREELTRAANRYGEFLGLPKELV